MTLMPVPQPAPFPAAQPPPFPGASPPATYGITAAESTFASSSPYTLPLLGTPTPFAPPGPAAPTYTRNLSFLASLTGDAIGPGNDPRTWTPDMAAQQTQTAIAKIGVANPELAAELAAKEQPAEDGGGFFSDIMGGLSKVLDFTGLDTVLEVLSRPAHILPEVIMDWGKEDVWKNVGDALLGKSDVSWDDVLVEKFGMERNFFTAAMGLVGDIALDPLTYIPLGRLASLGRETTSVTAAKAMVTGTIKETASDAGQALLKHAYGAKTAEEALEGFSTTLALEHSSLVDDLLEVTFRNADDALEGAVKPTLDEFGAMVFNQTDVGRIAMEQAGASQGKLLGRLQAKLAGVNPDALPGVINLAGSKAAQQGLMVLTKGADEAFEAAWRGNFAKAGEKLMAQGWSKSAADDMLKQWVKEGSMIRPGSVGKGLYTRGREAATQLGGWRFHLNIPVLGVRIAPMRILPKWVPMMDFSFGRRFFAGISGEMKMSTMLAKKAITAVDYRTFVQEGFSKLRPEVQQMLGGRFGRIGSAFMSASENMGELTKHLAPHAAMIRKGGLGGLRSAQLARMNGPIEEAYLNTMQTVEMLDGKTVLTGRAAEERLYTTFRDTFSAGRKNPEVLKELNDNLAEWVGMWPPEATGKTVDEMAASLPLNAMTSEELKRARELEAYFNATEGGFDGAHIARMQARQREIVGAQNGVPPEVDRFGFDAMPELTPHDAQRAAAQSPVESAHDGVWVDASGDDTWTQGELINADSVSDVSTSGASARGVLLRLDRTGIGTPAADTEKLLLKNQRAQRHIEAELDDLAAQLSPSGGVAVLTESPDALFEKRAALQAKLEKLGAEETMLTGRSRELVAYPGAVERVDLRSGVKPLADTADGGPINTVSEIESHVRLLQEQVDGPVAQLDEAAEAAMDPELRRLARELEEKGSIPAAVTRELQARGKAGIHVQTDSGEFLILFAHPKTGQIPVARIEQHAVPASLGKGMYVRAATEEARDAVRKVKAKDLPGGGTLWLDRVLNQTVGMTNDEAEEFVQRAMREAGVGVAEGKKVLEGDFFKALSGAQKRTARAIKGQVFGEATRTLQSLGLASSVGNGGFTGLAKYRGLALNEELFAKLGEQADAVKRASGAVNQLQRDSVDELILIATEASDQLGRHQEAIKQVLGGLDGPTYASVAGARVLAPHIDDAPNPAWKKWQDTTVEQIPKGMDDRRLLGGITERLMDVGREVAQQGRQGAATMGYANEVLDKAKGWLDEAIAAGGLTVSKRDAQGLKAIVKGLSEAPSSNPTLDIVRDIMKDLDAGDLAGARRKMDDLEADIFTRPAVAGKQVMDPEVQRIATAQLTVARSNGTARYLGDGYWEVRNPGTGDRVYYASAGAGSDDFVPIGAYDDVPEGNVVLYHQTEEANEQGILERGIDESVAGATEGEAPRVYGFKGDKVIPQYLAGQTPKGYVLIAYSVPIESLDEAASGASLQQLSRAGGEGVAEDLRAVGSRGRVEPGQILAVHRSGDEAGEALTGVRMVDAAGKVRVVADDTPSVRTRLTREHWIAEGVMDADDPVAAAAEVMKRQGIKPSAAEKKLATGGQWNEIDYENELHRQLSEASRAASKANLELQDGINAIRDLKTKLRTEIAQAQPALVPINERSLASTGMDTLQGIPGFDDVLMPTVMAKEFQRAVEGFKGIEGIHKEFRRFNAWWKSHATWMVPGFHIRNLYGAFFNNMLGGVGIRDYILAGRIRFAARELNQGGAPGKWANKTLIEGGDGELVEAMLREGQVVVNGKAARELTYSDLAEMTTTMGVNAGNGRLFAESRIMGAEGEKVGGLELAKGKKMALERVPVVRGYTKLAKGAGELTENVMRTAAFVRGMKTYGTAMEARAFTMVRHGDYSDMTDFEYGFVRDLIPFYKWMRTNTPFQIHQLLESPGKLLAVQKAQGAVFTAAGMDIDEEKYKMPKWMMDSFVIPWGQDADGQYESLSLDLPMSDLHTGANDFVTKFMPLAQPFIETMVTDKDLFTGAPVDGSKVPLAGVFGMPGIKQILDVTGLAEEGPDGTMYTTDNVRGFVGLIPEVGRFNGWLFQNDAPHARVNSMVSTLFGVRPRKVDLEAMAGADLDFYYSEVKPAMDHMRQMGWPMPSLSELDATYGSVQNALTSMGITPLSTTTAEAA